MRTTRTTFGLAGKAIATALGGTLAFGCVSTPVTIAWADEPGQGLVTQAETGDDAPLARWKRLAGATRYDTMARIVDEGWPGDDSSAETPWAVVATGDNYPDALTASAVAGAVGNVPIILTEGAKLSDQAKEELEKLNVRYTYIMGGPSAIGEDVEEAIRNLEIVPFRIAGEDRIKTSVDALRKVHAQVGTALTTVVVATGAGYADALSAGPLAYAQRCPIILTNTDGKLTDEAIAAIKEIDTIHDVILVGGPKVVSNEVEDQLGNAYTFTRMAGENRYETSAAVANALTKDFGHTWAHPIVATGKTFPDALAGSALAGKNSSVVILADSEGDETVTLAKVKAQGTYISGASYLLGGERAILPELAQTLNAITPFAE